IQFEESCLFASKETLPCCVSPSSFDVDLRGRGLFVGTWVFYSNSDVAESPLLTLLFLFLAVLEVPHPGGTDDQTLAWESWALAFYSGSSDLLLPPSSSSHLLSPLVQ
ncbi:hypothetical protein ILYODFUR_026669, partial [Ilyodon furcidens]